MLVKKTADVSASLETKTGKKHTATMEVQLHECNWTVYSIVIWILVPKVTNPGEVRFVQMLVEQGQPMFTHCFRVIFVEC